MGGFYTKYLHQDRRKVWQELLLLDSQELIKHQDDIDQILTLFTANTKQNIEIIKSYLIESNYVFTKTKDSGVGTTVRNIDEYPAYSFTTSLSKEIADLQLLVKPYGLLPLVFIRLYEALEYVNFEGYFPEWQMNNNLRPRPLLDPLVLMPIEMMSLLFEINDKNMLIENDHYFLGFSPTAYTKEDTSDDGMFGMLLSNELRLDNNIANYGKTLFFSDYLRNCFMWGGFPGLAYDNSIHKDDPNLSLIKKISQEMISI